MYFLYYNEQNHGPYALDQIRSMWASGIITADAVYWVETESMWKPIAELIATGQPENVNFPAPPFPSGSAATARQPRAVPHSPMAFAPTARPKSSWGVATVLMFVVIAGGLLFVLEELFCSRRTALQELCGLVSSEKTVAEHPDYKAAKAAETVGDNTAMLKHAKALVEQHPKSGLALRCLADALFYTEAYQDSLVALNKAIEFDPNDVVAWSDLAVVYDHMERTSDADAAFQKALKLAEKEPKPWADFGNFCISQERNKEAEKATRNALHLLQNQPFDTHYGELAEAGVWQTVGRNFKKLEKYDLAENAFKRATELDPKEWSAWNGLGRSLYMQDKNDLAVYAFTQATELAPQKWQAWEELGLNWNLLTWRDEGLNKERALLARSHELAAYIQLVKLNPKGEDGWVALGSIHLRLKQFSEAINCYEKAQSIKPLTVNGG